MKKKEAKSNIYACCLFGSSLGFPFGAQQNKNVWAIQPSQDSPQARDFWRLRASFDEVFTQLKLEN